ncbi:hypothetical protein GC425_02835 [Corynebacterium sp. zg254]|uniref:Uncharacterized protein n=1 Tax=Corynebacterium zhongnanshanii TaxID=2768834 RepID=A0ABQ6VH48_9CORY|nr:MULTISPECIES: hypothetical protein [Corynebacterium]KAB3523098.1 hypothetical protein F8377_02790 [Corynebacterium zhongnanshanii]MCR5913804.1 hypothetical protein [Corynebacterium sp. zg254]
MNYVPKEGYFNENGVITGDLANFSRDDQHPVDESVPYKVIQIMNGNTLLVKSEHDDKARFVHLLDTATASQFDSPKKDLASSSRFNSNITMPGNVAYSTWQSNLTTTNLNPKERKRYEDDKQSADNQVTSKRIIADFLDKNNGIIYLENSPDMTNMTLAESQGFADSTSKPVSREEIVDNVSTKQPQWPVYAWDTPASKRDNSLEFYRDHSINGQLAHRGSFQCLSPKDAVRLTNEIHTEASEGPLVDLRRYAIEDVRILSFIKDPASEPNPVVSDCGGFAPTYIKDTNDIITMADAEKQEATTTDYAHYLNPDRVRQYEEIDFPDIYSGGRWERHGVVHGIDTMVTTERKNQTAGLTLAEVGYDHPELRRYVTIVPTKYSTYATKLSHQFWAERAPERIDNIMRQREQND